MRINNLSTFFPVIETCKEDMKEEFESSPKLRIEIEQFTDEQMKNIAARVGEDLEERYWEMLREEVEVELMETTLDMKGVAGPYDIADFVCKRCLKQGVKR